MIQDNELEHLLKVAMTEPGRRPEFYRSLLEADVWIVVGGTASGNRTIPAGAEIDLVQWQRGDGVWIVPFFSSIGTARQGAPFETNIACVTGREFFLFTRGVPSVLNPNCEFGREFAPHEIEALLEHGSLVPPDCEILEESRDVYLEPLAELPTMVDSLRVLYATRPGVRAAYIVRARYASEPTRPMLLVGIETPSSEVAILEDTAAVVRDVCGPDEFVDAMPLNPRDGAIGQHIAEMTAPFYQRVDSLC